MNKLLSILAVASVLAFSACNPGGNDQTAGSGNDTTLLAVLTFDSLAETCIDKPVIIEGTVFHTCKHGGKRMFIIDQTDEVRVEVLTGSDVVKFDESLVGSRVRVTGFVREMRIDAQYLNEWEAELLKPEENHDVGVHTGAVGHEDHSVQDKLDQINDYRDQIKNSPKGYLSFFSVEATSYAELN